MKIFSYEVLKKWIFVIFFPYYNRGFSLWLEMVKLYLQIFKERE